MDADGSENQHPGTSGTMAERAEGEPAKPTPSRDDDPGLDDAEKPSTSG
jgi:hypothetical protein